MASEPSVGELLARMRRFEDHFVERKTANDKKDWLKTIVAFANSTPAGSTAVLFFGVTDAGEIEGQSNLDSLQKTLNKELRRRIRGLSACHESSKKAAARHSR